MSTFGLTPLMRWTLLIIQELIDDTGSAPTYQELAAELSVSSKTRARTVVLALEVRGFIRRLPGRRRSIEILRRLPMPEEPIFVRSCAHQVEAAG